MNDASKLADFLDRPGNDLLKRLGFQGHHLPVSLHRLAQLTLAGFRRGRGDQVADFVGVARQCSQTIVGRCRFVHQTRWHALHGADDQGWKTPLPRNRHPEIFVSQTEDLARREILGAVFLRHHLADFVGFLREIELRQQTPEAVKQGANEGLLKIPHRCRSRDVLGQDAGQVGAQEILLELIGIGLVLQMLEQEHGDGDIAHHLEAEDDDRPRDRADTAATCRPVVGGIDQPQQLVGQREILEDGIGELVHALVIAAGDAVNGSDRL